MIYPTLQLQTAAIEAALRDRIAVAGTGSPLQAMLTDAVLGPGKRLRPLLVVGAYAYVQPRHELASDADLLAVALAFELLHAASLIYDDLPCMDDAATRRGAPALHMAHGEAPALLTAISLQNLAYQWVAEAAGLPSDVRLAVTRLMAQTVGAAGLAAGQYFDLHGSPAETRHLKTGILFRAAAEAGALCAAADTTVLADVRAYADSLGTAFQLLDDLLDHDAPEGGNGSEAALRAEMESLLRRALAALDPARAAPLATFTAHVFGKTGEQTPMRAPA